MLLTIPAADYHAEKFAPDAPAHLSASIGKILIRQTPMHAWRAHSKLNPDYTHEDSETFDIGSAAHDLLLEGSNAKICIVEADDWRTKAAKEAREEARSNGLRPILAKHNAALNRMVEAAKRFVSGSEVAGVFESGMPEKTVAWQEPNGVFCKSRLDWITDDRKLILDYKTTKYISPEFCTSQIERMGYDFQESFYRRANAKTGGVPNAQFVFLFQSTSAPYDCLLAACAPSVQEIADYDVASAIAIWGECMESGKWPGYGGRIHYAEASNYKMRQHEDNLIGEAE